MTDLIGVAVLVGLLALLQWPLGTLLARAATSTRHLRVERAVYRVVGVAPDAQQSTRSYAGAVVAFSTLGVVLLTAILLMNRALPFSEGTAGMGFAGALSTAISFVTNTNWQWYSGEVALGYTAQAAGLTVQNFLSAAVGIAVAFVLVRALAAHRSATLGNFWVDITRITVRVLLPIAAVSAVLLIAGGVIQTLADPTTVTGVTGAAQTLPGGPVATQEAIKQLGTNGGGFFNANAAHPFENPTAWTNLLSMVLMLAIPFSLPRALGLILGNRRQGYAVLGAMTTLWVASAGLLIWAEHAAGGLAPTAAGAALEGKETRFGLTASALYAASTTGTSTGSVNAMHDSLTAPGGLIASASMGLGEIAPGGVGSGLYGMLVIAILAVFLAGLMVGRTPEIYGKRIRAAAMTRVALYTVATPVLVLAGFAATMAIPSLHSAVTQDGAHGVSSALYAYLSAGNNNGSAFGSFDSSGTPQLLLMGAVMLLGRFLPMLLVISLAGVLAREPRVPAGAGTMRTDGPLFTVLLVGVAVVVALLTYAPALALGPIAESLA
ncbi:potassium-transporting ATPase subunit KdpA [Demequina silvatica]|uniref:potassium-transporting ATPase subunit KdpA n=1 Tax=Demequina silvatica TaxID=1638988 RepID=UPI00078553E1|nr:potassium-transporting ATPase subunit KdpA [Demequina silvatica]